MNMNERSAMLEAKRVSVLKQFLSSWFLLGGFMSQDTYKRTMAGSGGPFTYDNSAYHLTLRKGLAEDGVKGRYIMAGHEWMLRQWFDRPLKRDDIELAIDWYGSGSQVRKFPTALFRDLLDRTSGDDIRLPIDVWGFPGGQTFFAGVPALSFEGLGGFVTNLEAQMCRYFSPIIHATKSRLMSEATGGKWAEFGYRSDGNELMSLAKLLALYVGGGVDQIATSCDLAEFLFPDYFRSIGTEGHEWVQSFLSLDEELDFSELRAQIAFATQNPTAAMLPDLISSEVGLATIVKVMLALPQHQHLGARVDSGDIASQCALFDRTFRSEVDPLGRMIVFEDEVSPTKVRSVQAVFRMQNNREPVNLFPGAGGYFTRVHRDDASAAFKRSWSDGPTLKFSDTQGKESFPGVIRVYARGRKLVVADVTEVIDGVPLYVKLVDQGRIVYPEDLQFSTQSKRANQTWDAYDGFEISPLLREWVEHFRMKRVRARERAKSALKA